MSFRKLYLGIIKKMKFLKPAIYLHYFYEYYTDKKLNLKNPSEFNEKIQWLKAYYHPPILTQLVDKYHVRDYVKKKVGDEYLNDLIDVYNNALQVDFDKLPNQFVIKGVHGFNFNLIVKDKSKLNKLKARILFTKWLMKNHYYRGGLEWAYKNVKPKLIAEKYLKEIDKEVLLDYKFYCFNGEPKFVKIDINRGINQQQAFYDLKWEKLDFQLSNKTTYHKEIKKPKNFYDMIRVAEKLAWKFPFVRVDLYNVEGRIIFGEMTFYPNEGRSDFRPNHYNKIIGDFMKLPQIRKNQTVITEI